MNNKGKFQIRLLGLTDSIIRYPLTTVFLLAVAVVNIFAIENSQDNYSILFITFLVGAFLSITSQAIYERFFNNSINHIMFMGAAVILAAVYYIIISPLSELTIEPSIRTTVAVFALMIIFIWTPSIKNKITFNESFMATFKAFFIAIFFSGVLFLGVSLILAAIDLLLTSMSETAYLHAANIIFSLFAPLYFLSLIPLYQEREQDNIIQRVNPSEEIRAVENKAGVNHSINEKDVLLENRELREEFMIKATSSNKFLETLISYVIIPITAVFTIILLLYILINITGSFWTDNLLEPLLVSYSITVIFVYLLASRLDNAFAIYFRKIFPKVLVPIVLFQTISSIIKIGDLGVTFGRYYAIMFGIFATIAGILFSILPIRKNGIIAPILIALAVISLVPPVDAFTVSRINHTGRLKNVLVRNNMLEDNTIKPNPEVPEKDRQIIVTSLHYLNKMEYTEGINWLGSYQNNNDFTGTFGFAEYGQIGNEGKNIYIYRKDSSTIPITGYDFLINYSIYTRQDNNVISSFELKGETYSLVDNNSDINNRVIILLDSNSQELLRFSIQDMLQHFESVNSNNEEISTEEATFTSENDQATITYIIQSLYLNERVIEKNNSAEGYLLIRIK